MTAFVLGVIGHVDHGKTALVRALTGKDTDQLPEEKQRGISIALGFACLDAGANTRIDLIDMPGHERFVRTMIAGSTGIDGVLLVVAANEGVMPQTVEHIDIAALLGITRIIVAVTKTDLVSAEQAEQVAADAEQLLKGSGLSPRRTLFTAAADNTGIGELRRALAAIAAQATPRLPDGALYLPVDRAFSVPGHGPVVTGTLRSAAVSAGDTLELWPLQRPVRVRSVQVHGLPVATATPGQRVAMNLRDCEIAELKRGMALAEPGALSPSEWLTVSIRAVAGVAPLKNGARLCALFGTEETRARLRLLDGDELGAGQTGFAQIRCARPVAVPAAEHVILRIASPARTVAGGRILEPDTHRKKRNSPDVLQRLEKLRSLPVAAMIASEVQLAGLAGAPLHTLSRLAAMTASQLEAVLEDLPVVVTRTGVAVWRQSLIEGMEKISRLLQSQVSGVSREYLQSTMGAGAQVLEEMVSRLQARGEVTLRGGLLTVLRPHEDRVQAKTQAALLARVAAILRRGGLTPPTPAEILIDPRLKPVVSRLLRNGTIVSAVDRAKNREILFHADAIEDAKRQLSAHLANGPGLRVTDIGKLLGISRKYSVPLLNYLDEIDFTLRREDRRVLVGEKSAMGK